MRKLVILFMILAVVLAMGCARELEEPPETITAPPLTPIEPEEEVVPEPGEERIEGSVEEEVVEEPEDIVILLTVEKTMSMSKITVKRGTTLTWRHDDEEKWTHVLAVETGKSFDTVRHAQSPQLRRGESWQYTFNERGTFLVRDLFSGKMRMYVTVTL